MPTDVAKSDSTQITMALHTSKSTACTGYRVGMALFWGHNGRVWVDCEKNWEKEDCGQRHLLCLCRREGWYQVPLENNRRGKLLTTKENMTTQQRLEKNILRWVVTSKQPFTIVQDPDFKQIFLSLATVWQLTMSSRNSDPSWKMTFRRPAARSLRRSMQQPPYPRDNWSLANDGIWISATGN